MIVRDPDPNLLDHIMENHTPGDDLTPIYRHLVRAHGDDLLKVRDNLNPLFEEISIIAGNILEKRQEQEQKAQFPDGHSLEDMLRPDSISAEVLDTYLHAATNQELEHVISTEQGYAADEAASVLTTRFRLRGKTWKPGISLAEESESQKEDADHDSPEDDLEEVE